VFWILVVWDDKPYEREIREAWNCVRKRAVVDFAPGADIQRGI
jgi:hypothetical protein